MTPTPITAEEFDEAASIAARDAIDDMREHYERLAMILGFTVDDIATCEDATTFYVSKGGASLMVRVSNACAGAAPTGVYDFKFGYAVGYMHGTHHAGYCSLSEVAP